jgi:hypothetical protein
MTQSIEHKNVQFFLVYDRCATLDLLGRAGTVVWATRNVANIFSRRGQNSYNLPRYIYMYIYTSAE